MKEEAPLNRGLKHVVERIGTEPQKCQMKEEAPLNRGLKPLSPMENGS